MIACPATLSAGQVSQKHSGALYVRCAGWCQDYLLTKLAQVVQKGHPVGNKKTEGHAQFSYRRQCQGNNKLHNSYSHCRQIEQLLDFTQRILKVISSNIM